MRSWQTNFDKKILEQHGGHFCMELVFASIQVMGIPRYGTKWSARVFGDKVVVFAEWSLDDEIKSGLHDL